MGRLSDEDRERVLRLVTEQVVREPGHEMRLSAMPATSLQDFGISAPPIPVEDMARRLGARLSFENFGPICRE